MLNGFGLSLADQILIHGYYILGGYPFKPPQNWKVKLMVWNVRICLRAQLLGNQSTYFGCTAEVYLSSYTLNSYHAKLFLTYICL